VNATPVRQPPCQIPPPQQMIWKRGGLFNHSRALEIFGIQKGQCSLVLCRLQKVTKKDAYPFPRVDDILEAWSGLRWFSIHDLATEWKLAGQGGRK